MLTKSFALLFYLKKRSNYLKGKLPIYLRLTVDSKRTEIAAKRECEPSKWSSSSGRMVGTKEEARALNAYLDTLRSKVYDIHRKLIEAEVQITVDLVKSKLVNGADQRKMILEIFHKHNEQIAALIGQDYAATTVTRYKTSTKGKDSRYSCSCQLVI